jgi:hypothetical protein
MHNSIAKFSLQKPYTPAGFELGSLQADTMIMAPRAVRARMGF